jgi:type IV pilus assembly protein PilO
MEQLIEKIMKAPPAVRWGGLAGAIVLVTGLCFLLIIMPLSDEIGAQVAQQRQLEIQLAEKQEIEQNLSERRRQMEALEQKLADALTQLPENASVDELLAQLNEVGRKAGLEISAVEPQQEQSQEFYARVPVKMQVTGNYHEIAMFLQDVSTLQRVVNINNIKLSSPTLTNDKILLKSEFVATAFRFIDESKKQQGVKK